MSLVSAPETLAGVALPGVVLPVGVYVSWHGEKSDSSPSLADKSELSCEDAPELLQPGFS